MMQFAHRHLKGMRGLTFYKLLGTGKGNGFNPWPDYAVYSLLQVWENESDVDSFLKGPLMKRYRRHSKEQWTLFMKPIKAHGQWSGQNPFEVAQDFNSPQTHIAVITRATIKKKLLRKFWKYVPTSEKPLENNPGLIYTKGVGEVPFLQMATFSLWRDEQSLKQFAYDSKEHAKAIKLTRSLEWYSEEMFVRFKPFRSEGTWGGADPLLAEERLE